MAVKNKKCRARNCPYWRYGEHFHMEATQKWVELRSSDGTRFILA